MRELKIKLGIEYVVQGRARTREGRKQETERGRILYHYAASRMKGRKEGKMGESEKGKEIQKKGVT